MKKILHLTVGKYLEHSEAFEYEWIERAIADPYATWILILYEDGTRRAIRTSELSIDEFEVIDVKDTPSNNR